jgi:hypothetical protein
MSSLKNRVAQQRNNVLRHSADIRRHKAVIQQRVATIGLDLGSLEWKNGRVSIQVSQRLGIAFLIASIAALILLKFKVRP